jgi:hypothetical protein
MRKKDELGVWNDGGGPGDEDDEDDVDHGNNGRCNEPNCGDNDGRNDDEITINC